MTRRIPLNGFTREVLSLTKGLALTPPLKTGYKVGCSVIPLTIKCYDFDLVCFGGGGGEVMFGEI